MTALYDARTGSLDIIGADSVEVRVRSDGKVIWVNSAEGLRLRICKIAGPISLKDDRTRSPLKVSLAADMSGARVPSPGARAAPWIKGRRTGATYVRKGPRTKPRAGSKRSAIIEALRDGPKTARELARLSGSSKNGLNSTLSALEAKRIIVRERAKGLGEGTRYRFALATATRGQGR